MEAMEASKVVEVIKVREVVSWKKTRVMVERMYASPSTSHAKAAYAAKAMGAAKAMHAAHAVHTAHAAHTAHRASGQSHWRGEHRHHDSTSDCCFANHDNPLDCQKSPRAIVRLQFKIFK